MRQITLERIEGEATVQTTVWVPWNKKARLVRLGSCISLHGEDERWVVTGISEPRDKDQIKRKWPGGKG